MYAYLAKYRAYLRKDRVRPEDLSDDPSSLKVEIKSKSYTIKTAEEIAAEKAEAEEALMKVMEREELDKFNAW